MKNKDKISFEEIRCLLYENAEKGFIHMTHHEDMQRFYYMIRGDMSAVEETDRVLVPELQGKLSDDPLRNIRYLFIINTGLAARFVVESGVPLETAYAISDLYIQKADRASSAEEIRQLNRELFARYVEEVRVNSRKARFSRPVSRCLNYIDAHFNEKITLADLAAEVSMDREYLAVLFKKEKGETFGKYLTGLRIETAKALLLRTDYTYSQIAYSLAYCSQSHFIKVFRQNTGFTPKQYRDRFCDV